MVELSTIYRLSVLLGTVAALLGRAATHETTSLGNLLDCWYIDEVKGRMGSFPGAVAQKKALLLLRHGVQRTAPLDFHLPEDVEPGLLFDVIDPTRGLLNAKLHRRTASREDPGSACELTVFKPQAAFVDWTLTLTEEQLSPPDLGGPWYTSILHNPQRTFSIASIHREVPRLEDDRVQSKSTLVAMNVFTHTPHAEARLGSDVLLDCSFSISRDRKFSVEWRYQFQGSGHVVYAYDAAADRVALAREGAELFFPEMQRHGNASLLLRGVGVKDEGTYLCIVYTPYLHAQVSVDLRITEPPQVFLRPDPLYVVPGGDQVLECKASAYYPLDVTVEWLRRNGSAGTAEYLAGSWQSNHQINPNGTFSLSSFVRVRGSAEGHGDLYTCYVSHVTLKAGAKKSLRLKVAGESGLSMDDVIGLFITAFLLYGLLAFLSTKVPQWLSRITEDQKDKAE